MTIISEDTLKKDDSSSSSPKYSFDDVQHLIEVALAKQAIERKVIEHQNKHGWVATSDDLNHQPEVSDKTLLQRVGPLLGMTATILVAIIGSYFAQTIQNEKRFSVIETEMKSVKENGNATVLVTQLLGSWNDTLEKLVVQKKEDSDKMSKEHQRIESMADDARWSSENNAKELMEVRKIVSALREKLEELNKYKEEHEKMQKENKQVLDQHLLQGDKKTPPKGN